MKYVNLGRSGLQVSRLCLGCMSYGDPERLPQPWSLDEKASRPLIRQALEAGINFFDTANIYSGGSSEEITGKALREMARRDEIVVATKTFFPWRNSPNTGFLSRKAIFQSSPDYLERYGTPEHPDDLLHHRCISNRLGDDRIYRWELERDGETYQITVPGSVTVNQAETGLVAVLGGAGLMYFPEPLVAPYVKDGRLRLVLTEWSPLEEGFYIYYSSRRQLPTGLRLLIEFIQEARPLGL